MHQKKSKNVIIYLILLLILGSINNLNLNNFFKFDKIKNINVYGLKEKNNKVLLNTIENLDLGNIFFINNNELSETVRSFSFVEKFEIFKKYPSSLKIEIKKTNFLARINKNNDIFIIGSNGKFLENSITEKYLPFIFGKPTIDEFLEFKIILDSSKFDYSEIKNLYYFPSKRWDILLKNNILLKLPRKNPSRSLDDAFKFLDNNSLKNVKILDLRINNQLITNG